MFASLESRAAETKCELLAEVLRSSGRATFSVSGGSMLPALWPGDIVTAHFCSVDRLQPGDLVLYLRQRRLFLHRVLSVSGQGTDASLLTQGDRLSQPDSLVRGHEFLGLVSEIHRGPRRLPPPPLTGAGLVLRWLSRFSDRPAAWLLEFARSSPTRA